MGAVSEHFETFGYVVLRGYFDPEPLSAEVDRSLGDAFVGDGVLTTGAARNWFRYVPLMCERTPLSLALAEQLVDTARDLLSSPVLPGRSKGTEYHGLTAWHRDADGPPRSIGVLCYLDGLDRHTGALQVIPGSQHPGYGGFIQAYLDSQGHVPAISVETSPGDALVIDERLFHASSGGVVRRQWRVDFIADSGGGDDDLTRYYARQHQLGWDGGYDVDLFPSYGPQWQAGNPRWTQRLRELGVFEAVATEEQLMRTARSRPGRGRGG